ncbi:MAG: hypothetical protein HUU56_06365 [Bdellovibrionaceae bacterium]|nr:hypothetical protein [Pseudobdellovibrionaceae bacterium]
MKKNNCFYFLDILIILLLFQSIDATPTTQMAKIKSYSLQQVKNDLNPFTTDCLNLLRPGNLYFDNVELINQPSNDLFMLRVNGKLDSSSRLKFISNKIYYIDLNDFESEKKFDFSQLEIPRSEKGDFSFSIPVNKGKIKIPLTLIRSVSESFELIVEIDQEGKLIAANLKPVPSLKLKLQMCLRNRIEFSNLLGVTDYSQNITQPEISISSFNTQTINRKLSYHQTLSQTQYHFFSFSSKNSELLKNNYYYNSYSHSSLTFNFLRKTFSPKWSRGFLGLAIYPYWFYGLGITQHSKASFVKTDTIENTTKQALIPTFGIEFITLDKSGWALENRFLLSYPYYFNTNDKGGPSLSFANSINRSLNQKFYIGFRLDIDYNQLSYANNTSYIDKSGNLRIIEITTGLNFGYWL